MSSFNPGCPPSQTFPLVSRIMLGFTRYTQTNHPLIKRIFIIAAQGSKIQLVHTINVFGQATRIFPTTRGFLPFSQNVVSWLRTSFQEISFSQAKKQSTERKWIYWEKRNPFMPMIWHFCAKKFAKASYNIEIEL